MGSKGSMGSVGSVGSVGSSGAVGVGVRMGTLRILLADDHTVVRQGLRKVLEERPDWKVVAEAGDGREAVRQAEQLKPDVAILDVAMPLLNGIEATRQIVKHAPGVRVLVLS